jgi:hypothetical protein
VNGFLQLVTAFGAGALGSLLAPWANWGIEKRRARLEHRRNQIKRWRQFADDALAKSFGPDSVFIDVTTEWFEMRPYVSEEVRTTIEGPYRDDQPLVLLRGLTDLEKRWKLI